MIHLTSETIDASKDYIIRIEKLVKTYDTGKVKVHALKGVDLNIEKGDMVSIMGPSGCGKTTLLNCASGIDDVTEGKVFIENQELHKLDDNKRTLYRARNMGFVFQFYNLLPVLNALENVEMPLLIAGEKEKKSREMALEALDMVGLKEWADHKPAELSGGQRQRVTIARALVNKPAIVWADEPTGDLDTETSNEVMDLLEKLNEKYHQTFVIVTHDPEVARRASTIVKMRSGLIEGIENEYER